jgi:hypothetical protein
MSNESSPPVVHSLSEELNHDDSSSVTLGPRDAAVIFRADGGVEIHIPKQDDQNNSEPLEQTSIDVVRCVELFKNDAALVLVDKALDNSIADIHHRRYN